MWMVDGFKGSGWIDLAGIGSDRIMSNRSEPRFRPIDRVGVCGVLSVVVLQNVFSFVRILV